MKTRLNQRGMVGPIEIFLLLVIVGIIGFVGWRLYEANQEEPESATTNSTTETEAEEDEDDQPAAEKPSTTTETETVKTTPQNITFTRSDGKTLEFRFGTPVGWNIGAPDNDGNDTLLIRLKGPSDTSIVLATASGGFDGWSSKTSVTLSDVKYDRYVLTSEVRYVRADRKKDTVVYMASVSPKSQDKALQTVLDSLEVTVK